MFNPTTDAMMIENLLADDVDPARRAYLTWAMTDADAFLMTAGALQGDGDRVSFGLSLLVAKMRETGMDPQDVAATQTELLETAARIMTSGTTVEDRLAALAARMTRDMARAIQDGFQEAMHEAALELAAGE